MQARLVTTLFASTALVALGVGAVATAAETEHDKHVFVNNCAEAGHIGSASGGVWRSVDTGRVSPSAAPSGVTTAPQAARFDAFIAVGGVDGESSDDPHRDPPAEEAEATTCPAVDSGQQAEQELKYNFSGIEGAAAPSSPPPPPPPPPRPPSSSGGGSLPMEDVSFNFTKIETPAADEAQDVAAPQAEQAALLVPAVQRVREAAARTSGPQMDGVVVLNQEEGQAGKTGTGTLTLSNGSASAQAETQQEEATEQRERPRRNFSLTIGGVTIGTGGVNVAVGDIDGDNRSESRASSRSSTRPVRADYIGDGRP